MNTANWRTLKEETPREWWDAKDEIEKRESTLIFVVSGYIWEGIYTSKTWKGEKHSFYFSSNDNSFELYEVSHWCYQHEILPQPPTA